MEFSQGEASRAFDGRDGTWRSRGSGNEWNPGWTLSWVDGAPALAASQLQDACFRRGENPRGGGQTQEM